MHSFTGSLVRAAVVAAVAWIPPGAVLAAEGQGGAAPGHHPDFDGDGFADLAIGAPLEDVGEVQNAGAVTVIYGSPGGLDAAGNQLWTQDSPGVLDAAERSDRFGWSIATGDFDGDGFDDLAICARFEDVAGSINAGAVNVLYGSPRGLTATRDQFWHQASSRIADRPEPHDQFGWSIVAGDFDADGFADLAASAPAEDLGGARDAGAVHVIYGTVRGLRAGGSQLTASAC